MAIRTATVLTHRRPSETAGALGALVETAVGAGAVLRLIQRRRASIQLTGDPDSSSTPSFDSTSTSALRWAATVRS